MAYHVVIYLTKMKPKCRSSAPLQCLKDSKVLLIQSSRLPDHQQVWPHTIKADVLEVCWYGAFRCVLAQCQEGKTSTSKTQLFLPRPYNTQRNWKEHVTSYNLQLSYQVHDNTITEKESLFTLNRAWQHSLSLHFASKPTRSLLEQCALDRQDQNADVCP